MANIARRIDEEKALESSRGGANTKVGAFDALFGSLTSAAGRAQQDLANRGISDPSYDEQCGATANNFAEFQFDDVSQLNLVRQAMPNPSNRRADGSRIAPPPAGLGQRYYSNDLGRRGAQTMRMNFVGGTGGNAGSVVAVANGAGTGASGGVVRGMAIAGGMAGPGRVVTGAGIKASGGVVRDLAVAGAGAGGLAQPQPQPQPQPTQQSHALVPQETQNSTPSQGRAKRMIKRAKERKKDPLASENEKRIAGIVKRDLNDRRYRSSHAYSIATDADEEEGNSQDWFDEAAEDYVDKEQEERRKSGGR